MQNDDNRGFFTEYWTMTIIVCIGAMVLMVIFFDYLDSILGKYLWGFATPLVGYFLVNVGKLIDIQISERKKNLKICSFCGEQIKKVAIICKHCGKELK